MKTSPIGIFDSGIGGLTVARELQRLMPKENFIYFGDSKHVPYGDKSKETIIHYSENITRFLLSKGCKAIVIACNTASANALTNVKKIAREQNCLVFDVISPVAEKVAFELNQHIGVIATRSTVKTHLYKKRIRKLNKHIKVSELATPLLVPVIEEGYMSHAISRAVLQTYLSSPKLREIDSLILGCTHYPLIIKEVKNFYEGKVSVVDSPLIVANAVYHKLYNKKLLQEDPSKPENHYYFSDITTSTRKLAKKFMGHNIHLELLDLEHHKL